MAKTDIDDATGVTAADADRTAQSNRESIGMMLNALALVRSDQKEVPITIVVGEEKLHTTSKELPFALNDLSDESIEVMQRALENQSLPDDPQVQVSVNQRLVFQQEPNHYQDGSAKRYVHPDFESQDFKAALQQAQEQSAGGDTERTERERDDGATTELAVSPSGAKVGRTTPDFDADTIQQQADEIGAQVYAHAPDKHLFVRVGDKGFEADSNNLSEALTTELSPADVTLMHQSFIDGEHHSEVIAIRDVDADRQLYYSDEQNRFNALASTAQLKQQQMNWNDGPEQTLTTETVPLSQAEAIAGQNEGDVSTDDAAIWMAQPTTPTITKDGHGRVVRSPSMEGLEATADLVERQEDQAEWIQERLQKQQANAAMSQDAGQAELAAMFDRCLEISFGEEGSATIVGNRYDISRDGLGGLSVTVKDGRGTIFERNGQSGEITSAATPEDLQKFAMGAEVLERQQARGASMPSSVPRPQPPAIGRSRQSDMEIG
jgi:hypothetical protein